MKKVLFTLALAIAAFAANAQKEDAASAKKFIFGGGANLGIVVGDYSSIFSLAYGADLQGEYVASDKLGLTVSAGYVNFVAKSGFSSGDGIIPVLGGARYYFTEKVFGSAQAGVSFATGGGGTWFTFAPGVGFRINDNIDIMAKYQSATKDGVNLSFAGIRFGYKF